MATSFDVIQQGFLHLVTFQQDPDDQTLVDLNAYVQNSLSQGGATLALDFAKVNTIPLNFFKEAILIQRKLKANTSRLVSINLNEALTQQLRSNGLDTIFGIVKDIESLRESGEEGKSKSNTIDAGFIQAFVDAATNIFSIQVGLKIQIGKPYAVTAANRVEPKGEVVAGTLSMVGETFKGSFCITLSHEALFIVYENMFKEKVTEMSDDLKDALAELVNMMYGQAKTVLNDKHKYGIHPALPTILSGNSIKVFHGSTGPTFCLPFTFENGDFIIEISSEK